MISNLLKNKKVNSRQYFVNKINLLSKSKRSTRVFNQNNIKLLPDSKRSQVTIFIILAIVIVAAIGAIFVIKGNLIGTSVPRDFQEVYSYYTSCISENALTGATIMGTTGGYIELPEFSPGSAYMPFSSQMDFLGTGVPYWYYISGNGIAKEQKPSKTKMESQLNSYVRDGLLNCDFSHFREKGFEIETGNPQIISSINQNTITLKVIQNVNFKYENSSFNVKQISLDVNSHLGKFYEIADKIYSNEKDSMFLENYGVDILRLYAPVDGSEISCSPKIWSVDNVRNSLMDALSANIPATKIKGSYYTLRKTENKYFVKDVGENLNKEININFMYDKNWPLKLAVYPNDNGIMKADPIGLQEGMGMLGFCYVPYHFVYDFAYPVLIQMYSGSEMFQFPVVVYINKNKPRTALDGDSLQEIVPELCKYKFDNISVSAYNTRLEPVEANIKFRCFDTTCDIGKTSIENGESILIGNFPQCVNGFIIANADGYETKRYQTTGESSVMLVMDKKYSLNLSVSGRNEVGYAVIVFTKNNSDNAGSITISYPAQKEIELTEGLYQIKVYVYSNSSINLQGESTQKCVDVPKNGIFGVFGQTEQKCFELNIPSQVISNAISGGGKENYYFSESELESSRKITLDVQSFGIPRTVTDLQTNYNAIDFANLGISLE